MTREEYNSRTNTNVGVEEFEFINRAYMAAGDNVDKDQFCKDIRRSGFTITLAALTERIEEAQKILAAKKTYFDTLAVFIAEQAEENYSKELRARAIAMMGEKGYITWKVNNQIDFWDEDRDLITKIINN